MKYKYPTKSIAFPFLLLCLSATLGAAAEKPMNVLMLIADGTSDNVVPYAMAKNMVRQLDKVKTNYSFYPIDGVAHRLQTILDTKFDGKTVRDHSLDFCFEAMKLTEPIKEAR